MKNIPHTHGPIYSERYRPDPVFMRDLKAIDSRLDCTWREDINLFVIIQHRAVGPPWEIFTVEREDGGMRQPDQRELFALHMADVFRIPLEDRLKHGEDYMRDYAEKQDAYNADEIRAQTKEDRRQLMPAVAREFNMGGKNNSTFRRIEHKPKGFTIKDLRKMRRDN